MKRVSKALHANQFLVLPAIGDKVILENLVTL